MSDPLIPGYDSVEKIKENVYVYYKASKTDSLRNKVILKIPAVFDSFDINRLQREYETLLKLQECYFQKNNQNQNPTMAVRKRSAQLRGHVLPPMVVEEEYNSSRKGAPIPNVIELESMANEMPMLVYECFGGNCLRNYISDSGTTLSSTSSSSIKQQVLSMEEKLLIAVKLCKSIKFIHESNYVYLNLCPDNIYFEQFQSGEFEIELQDFTYAANIENISQLDYMEFSNILYLSPEQTGRNGAEIDVRSDIYCLGLTLWELFAECYPFNTNDSSDLIYSHLVVNPEALNFRNKFIPSIISQIISKSLEKDPSERYQSAQGLESDLVQCLEKLQNYKTSCGIMGFCTAQEFYNALKSLAFNPGDRDYSPKLRISMKTYGRVKELKTTFQIFDNWIHQIGLHRKGTLLILEGAPGVGKSSIAYSLSSYALRQGYLSAIIFAKPSTSEEASPFANVFSILEQLSNLLLSESQEVLSIMKDRLINCMGIERLKFLCRLIPSLDIVFKFNESEELSICNSMLKNSEFYKTIQLFLDSFCTVSNPLLLTLGLIKPNNDEIPLISYLIESPLGQKCFFVAFSDNQGLLELDILGNKIELYEAFKGTNLSVVSIPNMTQNEVEEFLQEILFQKGLKIQNLAIYLSARTKGNFSLLREYILCCEKKGLIQFDQSAMEWSWDQNKIENELEVTDTEAKILISLLKELPMSTQRSLAVAACIGESFSSKILGSVLGMDRETLYYSLKPGMDSGYLVSEKKGKLTSGKYNNSIILKFPNINSKNSNPKLSSGALSSDSLESIKSVDEVFRFCHRSIFEYVIKSIDSAEFQDLSLLIAREKDALNYSEDEVLEHYNSCTDILKDYSEILKVARLNFAAGKKSQFFFLGDAIRHLQISESLFIKVPEFADELFRAQILLSRFQILELNRSIPSKKLEILEKFDNKTEFQNILLKLLQVNVLSFDNNIELQLDILSNLGQDTDSYFSKIMSQFKEKEIDCHLGMQLLKCINLDDFVQRSPVNDVYEEIKSTLKICEVFHTKNNKLQEADFFRLIGLMLTLERSESNEIYVSSLLELKAFFLGRAFSYYNITVARDISRTILDKVQTLPFRSMVTMFIEICKGSFEWGYNEAHDRMFFIRKDCIEYGFDGLAAEIHLSFHIFNCLPFGKSLIHILEQDRKFRNDFGNVTQMEVWNMVNEITSGIAKGTFSPNLYSKSQYSDFSLFLGYCSIFNAMLYDKPEKLFETLPTESISGTLFHVDFLLFKIINDLDLITEKSPGSFDAILENMEILEQLVTSQYNGEQRFKYLLAKAELEVAKGNILSAIKNYEDAIDGATAVGNLIFNAWMNERFGNFWKTLSLPRVAKIFLSSALTLWEKCGYQGKSSTLISQNAYLLKPTSISTGLHVFRRRSSIKNPSPGYSSHTSDAELSFTDRESQSLTDIDVKTILKVSNSIANEHRLDKLTEKLLIQLMSNTGASKAAIFIVEDSSLRLENILPENTKNQNPDLLIPLSLVNFVYHTEKEKVYSDGFIDSYISADPYFQIHIPKSIMCCPIKHHKNITGVLYLENNLQFGTFNSSRINLVKSLMTSASFSIANAQLQKANAQLSRALHETSQKSDMKNNVETPLQKILDAISEVKARFKEDDPMHEILDGIVSTLTSDGLFSADLRAANDKDGQSIDLDTRNWIEQSLLMTAKPEQGSQELFGPSICEPAFEPENILYSKVSPERGTEIKSILEKCASPDFDCFRLAQLSDEQPLTYLSVHLISKHHLNEFFMIPESVIISYFLSVEKGYNNLPYHSSVHAADVLQTVELLLLSIDLAGHFSKLEICALLISCAIHDMDHPGVNNPFLVQSRHPLSALYNDSAVLESHHLARGFDILNNVDCNIFGRLSSEQYGQIRSLIISTVLATDMSRHFQFLGKFKGKTGTNSWKMEDEADRGLIMEMAIKCGDLGNAVKPFETAKIWTAMVMEEFFRQVPFFNKGDKEKELGLPVSKFHDRWETDVSKCQVGFIDFLAAPLFEAWHSFSETNYTTLCIQNLNENRENWRNLKDPAVIFEALKSNYDDSKDLLQMSIPSFSFGQRLRKTPTKAELSPSRSPLSLYVDSLNVEKYRSFQKFPLAENYQKSSPNIEKLLHAAPNSKNNLRGARKTAMGL